MREIIEIKFLHNPELAEKLKNTGNAELIEGNNWHDNFWGDCGCNRCRSIPGQNTLGKLLIECRAALPSRKEYGKDLFRGFSCLSRQSYGADYIKNTAMPEGYSDEIFFGIYDKNGGGKCEAAVRWIILGKQNIPRFEVFIAGFEILYPVLHLAEFKSLIKTNPDFTPDDFSRFLTEQGFIDCSDKKL